MNNDIINLNDRGLEPGDDATPYLDEYFEAGAHIQIEAGTYKLTDSSQAFVDPGAVQGGSNLDPMIDGPVILESTGGVGEEVEFERNSGSSTAAIGFIARGPHEMIIRHVTFKNPVANGTVRAIASDEETVVRLENVNLPDGNAIGESRDATSVGILVNDYHSGRLEVTDCHIENFVDNGLYASAPADEGAYADGAVHVKGGLFKNNNNANVRLGTSNSRFEGGTIVQDEFLEIAKYSEKMNHNHRSMWIRGRTSTPEEPIVIEDVDIYHATPAENPDGSGVSHGVIWISNDSHVRMRDSRIYTETKHAVIRNRSQNEGSFESENSSVVPGSADASLDDEFGGSWECADTDYSMPATQRRWYKFDPDDSSRSDSTTGEYWGINPNSFGDSMRIGSVEVHRDHPFEL